MGETRRHGNKRDVDGDLLDLLKRERRGFADAARNDVRVHALLDELLALLEDLGRQQHDARGAVANLGRRMSVGILGWANSNKVILSATMKARVLGILLQSGRPDKAGRAVSKRQQVTIPTGMRTSASWDLAMSTRMRAAGCTTSSSFMMVAPSLEMVALWRLSTMSLSMPRGPSVVRTASLMTAAGSTRWRQQCISSNLGTR